MQDEGGRPAAKEDLLKLTEFPTPECNGNPLCDAMAEARLSKPGLAISALQARSFGTGLTDVTFVFADRTHCSRLLIAGLDEFRGYARFCGFPDPEITGSTSGLA